MRKLLIPIIVILLVACEKQPNDKSPYLVKVGNSVLSVDEADRRMLANPSQGYSRNVVVADWIDRELLFLVAQKNGLDKDETLTAQVNIYRKDLLGKTFMDNQVVSRININNNEIKSYYDKNRDSFKHKKGGAKILHFIVPADSVARRIANTLKQSNASIDRKEFLADYNVDVAVVENGELITPLDLAIFSNNRNNNIVGPIKTNFGYHVIEILSRYKTGSQINIDEAYDEIYQRLFNQKKALASSHFLDSLRNHYSIKINTENN